jgi:hypothetical protein
MSHSSKRPERGRALFHTRDSGGKHETTPGQYVVWAAKKSEELGLQFAGTPAIIEGMIQDGVSHRGDIFLDYDVCGNQLERLGLSQLIAEAIEDRNVTHILIPRRDRLARPDEPIDAMQLENSLRRQGITIVYMGQTLLPLAIGQQQALGEQLESLIGFYEASKFRRDLARNMILSKLGSAQKGAAVGGRPPYAFRRWFVQADGVKLRELGEGEKARMAGHHVVLLPVPNDHPEMVVVRRILVLLRTMPASQVAALLTKEGVPSPDANRWRTDRGIRHKTSGVWHANTVTNIARNSLLVAICTYGRRSMGDRLRFTPTGPRELAESDFRDVMDAKGRRKTKVIQNAAGAHIKTKAKFDPIVDDLEEHQELLKALDARGATQRGKPRSRNPDQNPLGGRVFDMHCGWLMYRAPHKDGFRYICGLYQQSHGQKCEHNHLDGMMASRFIAQHLRDLVVTSSRLRTKVQARVEELFKGRLAESGSPDPRVALEGQLATVKEELATVKRNLALAKTDAVFAAVSETFAELTSEKNVLAQKLATASTRHVSEGVEAEAARAMKVLDQLPLLVSDPANLGALTRAFNLVNVKIFASFQPTQLKKRVVNRLSGGVVTFGTAEPPVALYEGPTARKRIKSEVAAAIAVQSGEDVPLPGPVGSGREGKSLGNVSRGDRI